MSLYSPSASSCLLRLSNSAISSSSSLSLSLRSPPQTCSSLTSTSRFHTSRPLDAKRWKTKTELPFQAELRNPINAIYEGDNTYTNFGYVYDKKPFKVEVKKYHVYQWCGCGMSGLQPFCDITCKHAQLKRVIKAGPVKYIAPEDRDVWFCNCKQTKNRPFCDGSHRSEEIQEARIPAKFEMWEPREKPTE